MKHTFTQAAATGDTRIIARSAMGYDWNYFVAGEYQIYKHGDNELQVSTKDMVPGTGIIPAAGAAGSQLYKASVVRNGNIIETTILMDLDDLTSGGAALDIIGLNAQANCHIGQITAAVNGTIFSGSMQCLETPAGGEPDIDLYSASVATGAEDALIASLSGTELLGAGADWTSALAPKQLAVLPAADQYLYLVGGAGAFTDVVYSAGKFVIKFYGYPA